MTDSLNKLWLKGQAEEDIYIARHERELKEKKRRKQLEKSGKKTHAQGKQQ
jgi:hypothetical protein